MSKRKLPGEPIRLSDGKVVGYRQGDVAAFPVKRSRHFLRIGGGYSLDENVLEAIERIGITLVEFHDSERERVYRIGLDTFLANARAYNFGWGEKYVAPERFYRNDIGPALPGLLNPPPQLPNHYGTAGA